MANISAPGKKNSVTPTKLILIGVLSVILAAVLYLQFGSSHSPLAVTTGPATHHPANISQLNGAQSTVAPSTAAVSTVEEKKEQSPLAQASLTKTDISSNWQAANLTKVVQYDPFALPASFPQRRKAGDDEKLARDTVKTEDAKAEEAARVEAINAMQTQFAQLQHQGVRVIMQENDKFVALVGDRTIHVGDEIDGFKVVAIDAEGIRVSRDLKQ